MLRRVKNSSVSNAYDVEFYEYEKENYCNVLTCVTFGCNGDF